MRSDRLHEKAADKRKTFVGPVDAYERLELEVADLLDLRERVAEWRLADGLHLAGWQR